MSSPNPTLQQKSGTPNSVAWFITSAAVLLLLGAMVPSPPTSASEQADTRHRTVGIASQGTTFKPKPAIEVVRGIVDGIDEANDTIKIRLSPETSQMLKVQDGLIFNAVRFGDQVKVLVQDIDGEKTIVGLERK
ncbi:hypothetical protein [Bradyrhizobium sp. STM 3562]|uniref:hypothetical protein n=1 Tax=Bradyrhizobium sp. STM 3562 TaxID=578924 RepID=UPI00388D29F4